MKDQPFLKEVPVREAVGLRLGHDLTRIVPGEFKGRAFRKGHVIAAEDIPLLLDIGKEHIYIMDLPEGWVHEEDAALRMARAAAGDNVELSEPSEGKVMLKAAIPGLAKIDETFVHLANDIEHVVFSTIKTDAVVRAGASLAAARVVPLVVEEEIVARFETTAQQHRYRTNAAPIVAVKPFRALKAGVVTTGGEVFSGRIEDKFGPVLRDKLAALGSEIVEQRFSADNTESIAEQIRYFQGKNVDLILVTGGMSVDPDDRTPGAIKQAGADIVSYGTPMLPGSMMLFGYLPGGVPIFGLPGAVIYENFTSFDVLLPRVCAGERIERADIVKLGYGGLLK
ncbi:molybdopterin-binding protein [Paenibacillus sp.]|uniref:molybdopterin-binding protein n=1 Tax=Paenibacillus sp. TaxID=58172 RepID=UPI002D54A223|nr:molybdopterin-binding protein [Paenibacillus sp.]HZG86148.1 molybdopterin-binding protein [Paenibacillus sp.]